MRVVLCWWLTWLLLVQGLAAAMAPVQGLRHAHRSTASVGGFSGAEVQGQRSTGQRAWAQFTHKGFKFASPTNWDVGRSTVDAGAPQPLHQAQQAHPAHQAQHQQGLRHQHAVNDASVLTQGEADGSAAASALAAAFALMAMGTAVPAWPAIANLPPPHQAWHALSIPPRLEDRPPMA